MRPEDPKRREFDAQATPKLLDRVYRAARARLRIYAGRMQHVNAADVDDMVMGIIADTLAGTLSWDHEHRRLERHLLDAVRFRVRDEARKRWRDKARREVIDEDTTDVSLGESMLAGGCATRPDESHHLHRITGALVADLRSRIAGDADVEQLFHAIVVKGAYQRAEILEETGMSAAAYRNARRRLDRILLQLPPETRDAVMTAFTN